MVLLVLKVIELNVIVDWNHLRGPGGPRQWVKVPNSTRTRTEKKQNLGILLSSWWSIWKKRNRRMFENISFSPSAYG
jgi:hypothetical protein